MKIRCLVIVIFGLGLLLASCSNEPSTWQGNATDCSGCDSLYLGFHFGMSQEAFFDHCRGLNKAGVLKEGNKPNTVAQNLGGFTVGARTLMLPTFGEEGIERFDMRFQYEVLRMFRPDLTPMKLPQDVESYLTDELDIELETGDHP